MLGLIFILIIAGLCLLSVGQLFVASLFFLSAVVYVLATLLRKSAGFAKSTAKKAGAGIKKEFEAVGKASTSYPEGALSEMLKDVGRKLGEQAFDEHGVWSAGETPKEVKAKLGKTAKGFTSKFLGLFK